MRNIVMYHWSHWFWITSFIMLTATVAYPLSSLETISTSLKSVAAIPSTQITHNQIQLQDSNEDSSNISLEIPNNNNLSLSISNIDHNNVTDTPSNETDSFSTKLKTIDTTTLTLMLEPIVRSSESTKLKRVEDLLILEESQLDANETELVELNQSDFNDTLNETIEFSTQNTSVELEENDDVNSEGESVAKILDNISSNLKSVAQIETHQNVNDDKLFSEALFVTDEDNGGLTMNSIMVVAICIGIIGSLAASSIMFIYIYRWRFLNKPQALNDPDSSNIDDSTVRENSDEMYSLDNDSFLNSLEAMTIQNYWTDSVKHTKL